MSLIISSIQIANASEFSINGIVSEYDGDVTPGALIKVTALEFGDDMLLGLDVGNINKSFYLSSTVSINFNVNDLYSITPEIGLGYNSERGAIVYGVTIGYSISNDMKIRFGVRSLGEIFGQHNYFNSLGLSYIF